jgi:hypothetical protein
MLNVERVERRVQQATANACDGVDDVEPPNIVATSPASVDENISFAR